MLSSWNTHLLSVCFFNRTYAGAGCVHCSSHTADRRAVIQPPTVRLPSYDAPRKMNMSYIHTSCSRQTYFFPQTKQAGGTCHFKNMGFLTGMKSHCHIVSVSLPANDCDIWFCVDMWPGFVIESFASWHKQNMEACVCLFDHLNVTKTCFFIPNSLLL